jgi:hypothetical protein
MTTQDRAELLDAYRQGPNDLRQALSSFPPQVWAFKPAPDRWSVHELVVHLGDTEVQSHVRIRTIIAEPSAALPNFREYAWSQALDYANQDASLSLQLVSLVREINHRLLRSLEEHLWSNVGIHSIRGPETLETLVRGYADHMRQHIAQMQDNYRTWKERSSP